MLNQQTLGWRTSHPRRRPRGRSYKNMRYLLLKAQRMAVTNTEYVAFQKLLPRRMPPVTTSRGEPE